MTPEQQYMRELLQEGVKRAQQEAQVRSFELEEWERKNGFRRPGSSDRLDADRSYREVTGRPHPG